MFTMSYNKARQIQEDQIKWYHKDGKGPLTQAGINKLRAMTKPCPFDPDEEVSVGIINKLVPRGGSIETIMGIKDGGGA